MTGIWVGIWEISGEERVLSWQDSCWVLLVSCALLQGSSAAQELLWCGWGGMGLVKLS